MNESWIKALASYTLIAMIAFIGYSLYFAVVGDNSPFWIIVVVLCLPVILFASIVLLKKA